MAYLDGYCDLAYANSQNKSSTWLYASNADKNYAITIGRIYIDKNYTCSDTSTWDTADYTTIPEEVQKANAILAEQQILGLLITTDPVTSGPIVKKRSKAGSVESEIVYKGYYSKSGNKADEQPEATMLLSPYCSLGNSGQNLIRV